MGFLHHYIYRISQILCRFCANLLFDERSKILQKFPVEDFPHFMYHFLYISCTEELMFTIAHIHVRNFYNEMSQIM